MEARRRKGKLVDKEWYKQKKIVYQLGSKPTRIIVKDGVLRIVLISVILALSILTIVYMRCTISNYASFKEYARNITYIIDPDSKLENVVQTVVNAPLVNNPVTSPTHTPIPSPSCTPPLPTRSQTPLFGDPHAEVSSYFGYKCQLAVDVPEQCNANAFMYNPIDRAVESCASGNAEQFYAPCLMGIFESIGVGGDAYRQFGLQYNQTVATRMDGGVRFAAPGYSEGFKHVCPARSLPFTSGTDEYATQAPPYLLRMPLGVGKTEFGTPLMYSTSAFAQIEAEELGVLGATISPTGSHMSSVPYVSELPGVVIHNVSAGDIYKVTFMVDVGNLAYRPDIFYDTNDAFTNAFRLTEASYSMYARCRPAETETVLECALASMVHVEYSMSKVADMQFADYTSFRHYNPEQQTGGGGDDGYYNQFVGQKSVHTVFTVLDAVGAQSVQCNPVLVWDTYDLYAPVPPSVENGAAFQCSRGANVFSSFSNKHVNISVQANSCTGTPLSFCTPGTGPPGVNHCNRVSNNAGLVTTNVQSVVQLLQSRAKSHSPLDSNLQWCPGGNYSYVLTEYASAGSQPWCGLVPRENFTTAGSAKNTDGEPYNCCTGHSNRAYAAKIGIDFCRQSSTFCPSESGQSYFC